MEEGKGTRGARSDGDSIRVYGLSVIVYEGELVRDGKRGIGEGRVEGKVEGKVEVIHNQDAKLGGRCQM